MKYTKVERLVSSTLVGFPVVKRVVKRCYQYLNWILFRSRECVIGAAQIDVINGGADHALKDTFFGYYDEHIDSPDGDYLIYHELAGKTRFKPEKFKAIDICVYSIAHRAIKARVSTRAFNWQQGAKAKWIDQSRFIYNDYDQESDTYVAKIFDLVAQRSITIDVAHYDTFLDQYYLSLNFKRLSVLRPDYGYFAHKSDGALHDLSDDGIWLHDFSDESTRLLVSLQSLTQLEYQDSMANAEHKVNHICISPNGERFIFLHRWLTANGRRFDRLLLMNRDGSELTVLADDEMVSHCCWYGNDTVLSYMNYSTEGPGFYSIDLVSFVIKKLPSTLSAFGDGHPAMFGDLMVFDSYPDRTRMKHLYVYDFKANNLKKVAAFYEPIGYSEQTRCDLHPRWSRDGKLIYVDSTHSGRRQLVKLEYER